MYLKFYTYLFRYSRNQKESIYEYKNLVHCLVGHLLGSCQQSSQYDAEDGLSQFFRSGYSTTHQNVVF